MEARAYETVVVLNPNLTEEEQHKSIGTVEQILAKHGAQDLSVDHWGRRELAHQAKKLSHGQYYCFSFVTSNGQTVNNLAPEINILESVILYQSHRTGLKGRTVRLNPYTPDIVEEEE